MGRSKKADDYLKVRQIQEEFLKGKNQTDIVYQLCNQWKVSKATAYRYIIKALELFKEQSIAKIEHKKAYHVQARMKLFEKAMEINKPNPKFALEILIDLAKIEGLYVEKIDNTHVIKEQSLNFTYEQLMDLKYGKGKWQELDKVT